MAHLLSAVSSLHAVEDSQAPPCLAGIIGSNCDWKIVNCGSCHPVVVVQMDVQRYATRTSGWQLSESPWMSRNITLGLIFHMISPPPVPRLARGPLALRDTQPLSTLWPSVSMEFSDKRE
ncbi:unnamed protein product [Boreogadus saida]